MEPKPPQDRLFYRFSGHVMSWAGLGPVGWWWYKYPKILNFFFTFQFYTMKYIGAACFSSQLVFLYLNSQRLDKGTLSIVYSIIPIGFIATLKSWCGHTKTYEKVLFEFMDRIHLYTYYQDNKTEFVKTKLIKVEKATVTISVGLSVFMYCDWAVWMVTPILYNVRNIEYIRNGTLNFRTCYYMWMPFDYLYDFRFYFAQNIINIYVTFVAIVTILSFDLINYFLIFHLIGHIQILKYNIERKFVEEMSDTEIKSKLIEIIHHHRFIMNTFEDVKTAFGLSIACNYLQNLVEDGLLMYQFMLGDKESVVTYGLTLFYYMGGLVIMSLVLEEIRRETEDLSDILYCNIPWEGMSVPNQKTFAIILAQMKPVLEFVCLGCFKAGIMPAISIIKTTFSYYVMIKSKM